MTKLTILTPKERRLFDSAPLLNTNDRMLYFTLASNEVKFVYAMRTVTNKVGFVLQLGYFKSNGKFFTADQFHHRDIDYVAKTLGISTDEIDLSAYQKKIPADHRKKILELLCWHPFKEIGEEK